MIAPEKARKMLEQRQGSSAGFYYTIGVEVPARRGSTFSMRYTGVPSAREGHKLLRRRMLNKKIGMIGELVLASSNSHSTIVLESIVRRKNNKLEIHEGQLKFRKDLLGTQPRRTRPRLGRG